MAAYDEIFAEYIRVTKNWVQPVKPSRLVEWVERHPKSILHSFFEWDNDVAGHRWRITQAQWLVRHVVIIDPVRGEPIRYSVSLSTDLETGGGQRILADVLKDPDQRTILLKDALRDVAHLKNKYSYLVDIFKKWKEFDAAMEKVLK